MAEPGAGATVRHRVSGRAIREDAARRAVENRAVYVVLGVDMEGRKDVLGLWTSSNEGAKFRRGVLTELKNRGVRDILIACVDGLRGFPPGDSRAYYRCADFGWSGPLGYPVMMHLPKARTLVSTEEILPTPPRNRSPFRREPVRTRTRPPRQPPLRRKRRARLRRQSHAQADHHLLHRQKRRSSSRLTPLSPRLRHQALTRRSSTSPSAPTHPRSRTRVSKFGEIWGRDKKRVPAGQGSSFGSINVERLIDAGFGFATV